VSNSQNVLNLVDFPGRGLLYPMTTEDNQLLLDRLLTTCSIPRELLPSLKFTLLKGLKVQIVPGRKAVAGILQSFMDAFADSTRFKQIGDSELRLKCKAETLDSLRGSEGIRLLATYLGRYGLKLSFEFSIRDEIAVGSITWEHSPLLNVALFFQGGRPELAPDLELNMSTLARLRFSRRPSAIAPGQSAVSLEFQDKVGAGEFVTAFSRSFDLQNLSRDELHQAAMYFLQLSAEAGRP